ncbi:MAG: hypothetical protein IJZ47_10015, partial [Oscillospiraceae bacterium]|nr:hypothetical protein [Oscillospiraceae bacterium]
MPVSLKHPDRPDPSEVAAMALREYTPEHLTDEIYPQNSERVYTPIHQTEEKLPVDLSRECTPIHITSEEKQIHAAAPEDPEPADVSKSDNSVVTYSNYISHSSDAWLSYDGYTFLNELFTPDKLSTISITDIDDQFFTDTYSGDLGYIASASPIPMDNPIPDVEPDKIDPDATVKMTGDTIYDYTITNTTGDTTTFNEYVTNNYTYIT